MLLSKYLVSISQRCMNEDVLDCSIFMGNVRLVKKICFLCYSNSRYFSSLF